MVRDMVRQIQNLRKESGLRVEDRIHVMVEGSDEIHSAVEDFKSYFLNEVLGNSLNNEAQNYNYKKSVKIDGRQVEIGISQTN